jgi:hypothetical protein
MYVVVILDAGSGCAGRSVGDACRMIGELG